MSTPPDLPEPPPPPNSVAILAGFAYRLGSEGSAVGPAAGFSLGGSYERRYARLAPTVDLGVAFDFGFDQFTTAVVGSVPDDTGVEQTFAGTRTISSTSFVLLQTLGARAGHLHVWGAGGGGLAIDYFNSPEAVFRVDKDVGHSTAYLPVARGVVGADVEIKPRVAIGVRAAYSFTLKSSSFTTDMKQTFHLFGDLLDIHAGLFYRF